MAGVTEQDARRIRQIMQAEKISEAEFREICTLGRIAGYAPTPDGFDPEGAAWWHNATIGQWVKRFTPDPKNKEQRGGDGDAVRHR